MLGFQSCNTVNDDRIPSFPVSINLASPDVWTVYGVSGYGSYRTFIKPLRVPSNFPYTEKTYTGYGGVLLVCGVNQFTNEAGVPLAYDLACPVEVKPDVRVKMEAEGLTAVAVCPQCGSKFDVIEGSGGPIKDSGPAFSEKLGLRRYECSPGIYGGYYIRN